jgi:hypothetical protein
VCSTQKARWSLPALAGRTEDQFQKIASEVPKHYLSECVAIYNVLEVDKWVKDR